MMMMMMMMMMMIMIVMMMMMMIAMMMKMMMMMMMMMMTMIMIIIIIIITIILSYYDEDDFGITKTNFKQLGCCTGTSIVDAKKTKKKHLQIQTFQKNQSRHLVHAFQASSLVYQAT